jgi:signal transduction histidine kinase
MLEGVDTQWQEAGNRRSAYYTTLAPGSYRFRVVAANEDGVWNTNGASVLLVVPPALVQTVWFKLLIVAVVVLLAWAVHRLRLRQALRRMQRSFDVRMAERERIARTLHDTYLQSVQSLILRFHSIKAVLPKNDVVQLQIDAALEAADVVAEEGRDQLMDLRVNHLCQGELAPALESTCGAACAQQGVAFSVSEHGPRRALQAEVKDELFAIAREAVSNALRHSGSAAVSVQLVHDSAGLTLQVRDQGKGFDDSVLQSGQRERHWGLAGMRERATRIGARLTIHSKPDDGTAIELALRARLAYR